MRSLKRSIARAAMKAAGITRINKRQVSIDPQTGHPLNSPASSLRTGINTPPSELRTAAGGIGRVFRPSGTRSRHREE